MYVFMYLFQSLGYKSQSSRDFIDIVIDLYVPSF